LGFTKWVSFYGFLFNPIKTQKRNRETKLNERKTESFLFMGFLCNPIKTQKRKIEISSPRGK